MKYNELKIMLYIAKQNGLYSTLHTSTTKLSKLLHISQQSVSRILIELENNNFIKRAPSLKGMSISLTEKGILLLKNLYNDLGQIFKKRKKSVIGIVEKGIGEGKYYMSLKQYQDQFKKKLGFKAYPGTLNIKVKHSEILPFLSDLTPIPVRGFETKSRTYGALTCYKVKIGNISGAVVIPERTRHQEGIIEIISPAYLRDKCKLKDRDRVKISV